MRWGSLESGARHAATSVVTPADDGVETMLVFHVGGQAHAVPLEAVDGVARAYEVRPIPQPAQHVIGVIDRAGVPVPVIDLSAVLEVAERACRHVLIHRSPWGAIGFMVEEAAGVGPAARRALPDQLMREGGVLVALAEVEGESAYVLDLDNAVPAELRENHTRASRGGQQSRG